MAPTNKKLLLLIFMLLLIVSIFSLYIKKETVIQLPLPAYTCKSELSWKGLVPGQSSREDVLNILGEPASKGNNKIGNRNISYFVYNVDGGKISNYAMDRIFFRPDGLIDWIEAVEADRDGDFSILFDTATQLGNNVDVIYSNNNYRPDSNFMDVLIGPDRIYVWSECGLALDVLSSTYSPLVQSNQRECTSISPQEGASLDACNLNSRHPSPHGFENEPEPDVNSIVLMKFYFQPTSYEAFTQYYMYKIPYGMWDIFLDSYR